MNGVLRAAVVLTAATLVLAGQQAAANVAFTDEQLLSAPGESAAGVATAAARDGRTAVAVWVSRTSSGSQIQARTLRDGVWGPAAALTPPLPELAAPQVDISPDGATAVAAWQQGVPGAATIRAAFLSAGGWGQPRAVSAADARNPRVALNAGDGAALAVWDRAVPTGWRVEAARGSAAGWAAPETLAADMGSAGIPAIDVAAEGSAAMAVWQHQRSTGAGPTTTVESSRWSQGGWSAPVGMATAAGGAVEPGPQVAVSGDGATAQALWTDTGELKSVRSAHWSGSAWGPADTLSGSDNGTFGYTAGVSDDGSRAWVVFSSQYGGVYRVRARTRTAAGWGPPVGLSAGERQAVLPDLAISADGLDGAAVWRESELGAGIVRVAALRGGSWRPAVDAARTAEAAEPSLALSRRARSGWVAWAPREGQWRSQSAADDPAVHVRRVFTPPDPPTGVVATGGTSTVSVTWQSAADSGVPVDSYTATADPGGATCSSTGGGCAITGLRGGRSYRINVVAVNAAGASEPAAAEGAVSVASAPRTAQTLQPPPKRVKKGKRKRLAPSTRQRIAVSWSTRTKRVCSVRRGSLVAVRKGRCRLRALAPATPEYLALRKRYTVKIWQPAKKKATKGKKATKKRSATARR